MALKHSAPGAETNGRAAFRLREAAATCREEVESETVLRKSQRDDAFVTAW
ncbi:MAG: hypothetical protein O2955_06850 [Planctomycetota bacterium]|nr:hypothetical protein [Planctomycetota bacterium]MDA1212214.1 hypothetical protein [Planctomycetota bacterium]